MNAIFMAIVLYAGLPNYANILIYALIFGNSIIMLTSIIRICHRLGNKAAIKIDDAKLSVHNSLSNKWKEITWSDIKKIVLPEDETHRNNANSIKLVLRQGTISIPIAYAENTPDEIYETMIHYIKEQE